MSPRKKARAAIVSAFILLFLSGLATSFAITRLLASQERVNHTHEVQVAIGDVDSSLSVVGRARSGFVLEGDDDFLNQFETAVLEIPLILQHLRELTRDNPHQQDLCSRLEEVTNRRVAIFRESVRLHQETPQDVKGQ